MSASKGWIGFDLDGTLAHYEGWQGVDKVGEPIAPMIQVLKEHLASGETCKIFTARMFRRIQWLSMDPTDEETEEIRAKVKEECNLAEKTIYDWLQKQGLPRLELTCTKDFGMIMLYDDRCKQVETNTGRIATFQKPMNLKLGKRPAARPKATDLHFGDYRFPQKLRLSASLPPLPNPPWGNTQMPNAVPWGMLGNDRFGDCVDACSGHLTMLQAALAGKTVSFSDASILQTYSEQSGFDPSQTQADGSNPTDQGTVMADFMDFWKNKGIIDDAGNRHKILAWARLNIHNLQEVLEATFIFKMVPLGISFPASAMQQTQDGQPWSVVAGSANDGGHCIGSQGFDGTHYDLNTWAINQLADPDFLSVYLDEGYVVITEDFMEATGDVDGFDLQQLLADANALSV